MANEPQNAQDLFGRLLPIGLTNYPDRAREINAIFGFKIEGEGGGYWVLDCTSSPPTCTPGDTGKAQCTIELEHEDFKKMLTDHNTGMDLYFKSRIRVSGEAALALKLGLFFEITRPK